MVAVHTETKSKKRGIAVGIEDTVPNILFTITLLYTSANQKKDKRESLRVIKLL